MDNATDIKASREFMSQKYYLSKEIAAVIAFIFIGFKLVGFVL